MKHKLCIMIALLLPTFLTAEEKPVQVPPCIQGNAFTIRIPIKFPDSMTVQYAWYRNDTLIEDTHKLLLGEKAIAYTVPAEKAFGSAVYHFTYRLDDKHYDWTNSPHYMVSFLSSCPPIPGTVSVTVGCVNDVGTVGVADVGCVSDVGTVNVAVGGCVSNAGAVSVAVGCVSDVGTVGVDVGCVSDVGTISFSQ